MKKFEYYVLNYDHNKKEIVNYNIFNNFYLNQKANELIEKYYNLKNKNKYTSKDFFENKVYHGFEALCYDIKRFIMYEEWSRFEYEIAVGPIFEDNFEHFQKIDCYFQAKPNIPMIVRELLYQYKTKEDINE